MTDNILTMTTDIVSSYVSANDIDAAQLPDLIRSIHAALDSLGQEPVEAEAPSKMTAVAIRRSITPNALISFIDGRPYKFLKRHLTAHGLTFDEYRAKFGLPSDYPKTSPAYSERRSDLAKTIGLGRKPAAEVEAPIAKRKRGRPAKS
jgi:predicted transcriptional regulator